VSDLTVREALLDDLPAIVAMLADDALGAARENPTTPLERAYLDGFAAIEADPNHQLLVGSLGAEIVATLQVTFLPGLSHRGMWRGQVESVRVASAHRGKGLGAAIMAEAVARCRARGCGLVQLGTAISRTDAHRFYARLGFERSHYGFKMTL
jgi:GNAT superfamily N-acetyltransferase